VDGHNLFETPATYRALRAEYVVPAVVAIVLLVMHIGDVRIVPALVLFFYNDTIGYVPGAIAYRRSEDGQISKVYYVLYNVMHSIVTSAVVAGLWVLLFGAEWALLVMVIHISIDRAVFGNFIKQFSVEFEPKTHPVYAAVAPLLARDAHSFDEPWVPTSPASEDPKSPTAEPAVPLGNGGGRAMSPR
jgi:hypothetical protein